MRAKSLAPQILALLCSASVTCAVTVHVPGSKDAQRWWVNTGLSVSAGQVIRVTAAGSWFPHPDHVCGPDGSSGWFDHFLNAYHLSGRTDHFGALIGYIGSSPPAIGSYADLNETRRLSYIANMVLLGSNASVTAPVSGTLWLGMNDDAYSANCSDNGGGITATVGITRGPHQRAPRDRQMERRPVYGRTRADRALRREAEPAVARFDVYRVDLGSVVGGKNPKTKPCVIVSSNEVNARTATVIVAPMTAGGRDYPTRVPGRLRGKQVVVALDQMRAVNKSRLTKRLGTLDQAEKKAVLGALMEVFGE